MHSPQVMSDETPHAPEPETPWSAGQRHLFRFACVYLALYIAPFPLGYIFGLEGPVDAIYGGFWRWFVPWFAAHVLHLAEPITVFPAGSGDTTFNWVQVLMFALLALLGAGLWGALARRRLDHRRALLWLTFALRLYLATRMFEYGFAKAFKMQFPAPGLSRLVTAYGDSSPMGLAWTFMGYSALYTVFTGVTELVGGALLLWRRTALLGSLIVCGVMTNVVMLNLGYDIPVKLFSMHLLAMAGLLVALDGRRVVDVFLRGRATPALRVTPPLRSPRAQRRFRRCWIALASYLALATCAANLISLPQYGPFAPRPPLYGLYEVERFVVDGEEVPPLLTEEARWRWVIFDRWGDFIARPLKGERIGFLVTVDEDAGTLTLTPFDEPGRQEVLTYVSGEDGALVVLGVLSEHVYRVELRRVAHEAYLLRSRGFHWIQERPYNR